MKSYSVTFGSGDPRGFTGLSPTFLLFWNLSTSTTNAPPSIAELVTGKTGIYSFNYGVTQPIAFLLDAATTSPGTTGRYVSGQIDPSDRSDEYGTTLVAQVVTLTALGTSNIALGTSGVALGTTAVAQGVNFGVTLVGIGNTSFAYGATIVAGLTGFGSSFLGMATLLGSTSSSFGSTSIDPTTIFGFLKRAQEVSEGNSVYAKTTGVWDIYSRGSSTLLREKTISDTTSQTSKT